MQLISINLFLICLFFVFQFSGCSLPQQNSSKNASLENKAMNSPSKTPRIVDSPAIIWDKNFAKKWKSKYGATYAKMERNRQLWRKNNIVNYNFVVDFRTMVGCTCLPAVIKVREGKMISMGNVPDDYTDKYRDPKRIETVEKLFDLIKQELDAEHIVDADYNNKLGYPERIVITNSFQVDNQVFYEISKFEIIK
ncbi:hypothetical protein BH10ACI1_BH10ACI1_06930 [soil metagenome]